MPKKTRYLICKGSHRGIVAERFGMAKSTVEDYASNFIKQVFYMYMLFISKLQTFLTYGHPLVPCCPDKGGLTVQCIVCVGVC